MRLLPRFWTRPGCFEKVIASPTPEQCDVIHRTNVDGNMVSLQCKEIESLRLLCCTITKFAVENKAYPVSLPRLFDSHTSQALRQIQGMLRYAGKEAICDCKAVINFRSWRDSRVSKTWVCWFFPSFCLTIYRKSTCTNVTPCAEDPSKGICRASFYISSLGESPIRLC